MIYVGSMKNAEKTNLNILCALSHRNQSIFIYQAQCNDTLIIRSIRCVVRQSLIEKPPCIAIILRTSLYISFMFHINCVTHIYFECQPEMAFRCTRIFPISTMFAYFYSIWNHEYVNIYLVNIRFSRASSYGVKRIISHCHFSTFIKPSRICQFRSLFFVLCSCAVCVRMCEACIVERKLPAEKQQKNTNAQWKQKKNMQNDFDNIVKATLNGSWNCEIYERANKLNCASVRFLRKIRYFFLRKSHKKL